MINLVPGPGNGFTHSNYRQHPSPAGQYLPFRAWLCSGMKHQNILVQIIQPANREAGLVATRVSGRGHYHPDAGILTPFYIYLVKVTIYHRQHNIYQVSVESGEGDLGLRVTEPSVEFNHFRPFFRNHQSAVEDAFIGHPFFFHTCYCRLHNIFHYGFAKFRGIEIRRTETTHTAGIRSPVSVIYPFIIAGARHRHDRFAIAEGEATHFPPGHLCFNNNPLPRRSQRFRLHKTVKNLQGIGN